MDEEGGRKEEEEEEEDGRSRRGNLVLVNYRQQKSQQIREFGERIERETRVGR